MVAARPKLRPAEAAMAGCSSPLFVFGMRDVAWSSAGRFQHPRVRSLVAVTFAWFSLRCPCSQQSVHSGLYDGLTWPDTGYASLD